MMNYLYVQITKNDSPTHENVEIDTNAGKSKVGAIFIQNKQWSGLFRR